MTIDLTSHFHLSKVKTHSVSNSNQNTFYTPINTWHNSVLINNCTKYVIQLYMYWNTDIKASDQSSMLYDQVQRSTYLSAVDEHSYKG